MNYFEFFGLEVTLYPKLEELSKIYRANIFKNHPDLNNGSDVSEQFTAINNVAYKTLKDETKRIAYVLKLLGGLGEDTKNTLPASFLMEMMEVNESLSDAKIENSNLVTDILKEIRDKKEVLWNQIRTLGNAVDTKKKELSMVLPVILNLFLQSKYLDRILDTD